MKKLSIEEIEGISKGLTYIKEGSKGLSLYRLPASIFEEFQSMSEGWRIRGYCSTGVILDCISDTKHVSLNVMIPERCARKYCYFDFWVDGLFVDYAGTEDDGGQRMEIDFEVPGEKKEHHIQIYLPHTREVFIESISVSENSEVKPAPAKKTWLAYGDSITQGMNASNPSLCYVAQAARLMNMDVYNTSVGGARFETVFVKEKIVEQPDLITVAFGTNDWSGGFPTANAGEFLEKLRNLYPDNKIFVLSPIWREFDVGDVKVDSSPITFKEYRNQLKRIVSEFDNVCFIEKDFLHPSGMKFMADGTHPDTAGQMIYGANLAALLT